MLDSIPISLQNTLRNINCQHDKSISFETCNIQAFRCTLKHAFKHRFVNLKWYLSYTFFKHNFRLGHLKIIHSLKYVNNQMSNRSMISAIWNDIFEINLLLDDRWLSYKPHVSCLWNFANILIDIIQIKNNEALFPCTERSNICEGL